MKQILNKITLNFPAFTATARPTIALYARSDEVVELCSTCHDSLKDEQKNRSIRLSVAYFDDRFAHHARPEYATQRSEERYLINEN